MDGLTYVRQVKFKVQEKEGILCRQQHWYFAGRLLDDSWSKLCHNDIHDGATLDLVVGSVDPADVVNPAGSSEPNLYFRGPFGEIRYFPLSRRFCAFCENPARGRCRINKRGYEGANSAQGRPLGFLMAWLQDCGQKNHQEHLRLTINISRARRQQGRAALHGVLGSEALFAQERARRNGEPEEPLECP
jgi:hypothetical protein